MSGTPLRDSAGYVAVLGGGADVVTTIGGLALAALTAAVLAPRSRVLVGGTGLALAVVVGVTVVPVGGWRRFALTGAARDSIVANLHPRPGDLSAWATTADGPLNVALFVPLGFFLALLLRRPSTAAVAAVALSVAIECYQSALTTRVGAFADVVSNSLGALLGAAVAALVLRTVSGSSARRSPAHRPGSHRRPWRWSGT